MSQPIKTSIMRLNQLGSSSVLTRNMAVRWNSSCKPMECPRCSPKNLSKTKCAKDKAKGKQPQKKGMWFNPDCCLDPCKDMLPRFDDLYYCPSNKEKRTYQQTWVECPKLRVVKRPICKYDEIPAEPSLSNKRCPSKSKPKTACSEGKRDRNLMKCLEKPKGRCPRISMRGCRPGRNPPRCFILRTKTDCKKVCTPYPSFSECKKDKIKLPRPVECSCLEPPSMCEAWREFHRRLNIQGGK